METICEGCEVVIKQEEKTDHYMTCKNAPFLYSDNAEVSQQADVYKQCFQELENWDESAHLYKNMQIGDNIIADIPCTGCPNFAKHLEGNCLADKNVKNFMASATFVMNKTIFEYKKFLNLAEQHYNGKADSMEAEALELTPDLTPELIATLTAAEEIELKYRESIKLFDTAAKIKSIAVERNALFLEKKENDLNKLFGEEVNDVEWANTRYIVEQTIENRLEPRFLELSVDPEIASIIVTEIVLENQRRLGSE